jgi:hypothetical protein
MKKPQIEFLVSQFFAMADTDHDKFLQIFSDKIKLMSMDDVMEMMHIIADKIHDTSVIAIQRELAEAA